MPKRFLYLSDYYLLAYKIKGKTLQYVDQFHPSSKGQEDFVKYLTADPKTPIICLLDTTQEEYRLLYLPHVRGKDREELLTHKIKRLFEHTPYTYSVVQGREQQGRGDDQVLFTALSHPNLLQPWLALIATHKVPLMGICSLPLLSQLLLKYLPKAPYTLLVTPTPRLSEQSALGLRQSFFGHQRLHLSRLIPLTPLTPLAYAETVAHQVIKTQRYLETAKLLPTNGSLSIIVLTDTVNLAALHEFFQNKEIAELNIQILEIQQLAQQLGGYFVEEPLYLHHLLAYLLSKKGWTHNHYAKSLETRYLRHRWIQTGLYITSALFLVGATLGSVKIFHEALTLRQQGWQRLEQIKQRQADLDKLGHELPSLPTDVRVIRNVVDVGRHLKSLHILPRPILEKLSQSLSHHERLLIEQLEWGIGNSTEEIFSLQKNDEPPPEQEEMSRKKSRRLNKVSKKPPLPNYFLEAIRIHGRIHPFENYPEALHLFNKFVQELRKHPETFSEVKELLPPYNPQETLQGEIGSLQEETAIAPFSLEIIVKHAYLNPPSSK